MATKSGEKVDQITSLPAHARLRPRYHQNPDGQLGALRAVGCIRVYAEKASGKDVTGRR
jgi:hypothetical protein